MLAKVKNENFPVFELIAFNFSFSQVLKVSYLKTKVFELQVLCLSTGTYNSGTHRIILVRKDL